MIQRLCYKNYTEVFKHSTVVRVNARHFGNHANLSNWMSDRIEHLQRTTATWPHNLQGFDYGCELKDRQTGNLCWGVFAPSTGQARWLPDVSCTLLVLLVTREVEVSR